MKNLLNILFSVLLLQGVQAQWDGTNPVYFTAGNVGIGLSSPIGQLHLASNQNHSFNITRANGLYGFRIFRDATYGRILFQNTDDNNNSGTRIQIEEGGSGWQNLFLNPNGGNVGIGTTSPSRPLDVNGGIASRGQLVIDGGTDNQIDIGDLAGGDGYRDKLNFWTHDGVRMTLNENGNLGIGNTTPADKLDIGNGGIRFQRITTPLTGGAGYGQIFQVWNLDGNSDGLVYQSDLHQFRNFDGTPELMIKNGNVGIGTTSPDEKLTVNGTVHAKEVKVDLSIQGPDYVFEPNYKLLSLEEIKSYIDQHKHLPEVPSAKEMETNGVNVSEMNMILLKKIEELTLYILNQEKRILELEKINNKAKE